LSHPNPEEITGAFPYSHLASTLLANRWVKNPRR
jgi:hypothetical protein